VSHRRPPVRPRVPGAVLLAALLWSAWGDAARGQDFPADGAGVPGGDSEAARMARARSYFDRGVAFADEERWGEALEFFRRSDEIVERPSTVFNMGVAQYRLGAVLGAIASLERFLEIADPVEERSRRRAARELLERLRPAVATLVFTVAPADARVLVDGEAVLGVGRERTTRVDPGRRQVEVTAPGHLPVRAVVAVLPGGTERRTITLSPAPPAPASLQVRSDVDDALIRLGEDEVGIGSVELQLSPGPYVVQVRAEGYHDFAEALELDPGERVEVTAGLKKKGRLVDEAWFWVITGVVVAGAATGVTWAVLGSRGNGGEEPYDGTTGVVIQGLRF